MPLLLLFQLRHSFLAGTFHYAAAFTPLPERPVQSGRSFSFRYHFNSLPAGRHVARVGRPHSLFNFALHSALPCRAAFTVRRYAIGSLPPFTHSSSFPLRRSRSGTAPCPGTASAVVPYAVIRRPAPAHSRLPAPVALIPALRSPVGHRRRLSPAFVAAAGWRTLRLHRAPFRPRFRPSSLTTFHLFPSTFSTRF